MRLPKKSFGDANVETEVFYSSSDFDGVRATFRFEFVDQLQFFGFLTVAKVAGKAYPAESLWQHMHKEEAYEFRTAHIFGLWSRFTCSGLL